MLPDAIRCSRLTKTYPGPVEAVRALDLTVRGGECFGLLGPNGAGKTTTIEILEGLLAPTSGEAHVLGEVWGRNDRGLRERIGISLQETRLPDRLTVAEIVRLFRSFYSRGRAPEECVRLVGLEEKEDVRVGTLSGGQKQRLALACALVGDPELLFLDEPTTGLDPASRRQVWDVLGELRRAGRTILLTTHYMEEAERLCDRVGIVDRGRLVTTGRPEELIRALGGEHVIELACADDLSRETEPELAALPSVSRVQTTGGEATLAVTSPHLALPALLDVLRRHGARLTRLSTRHASLEDVFVELTGHRLEPEE